MNKILITLLHLLNIILIIFFLFMSLNFMLLHNHPDGNEAGIRNELKNKIKNDSKIISALDGAENFDPENFVSGSNNNRINLNILLKKDINIPKLQSQLIESFNLSQYQYRREISVSIYVNNIDNISTTTDKKATHEFKLPQDKISRSRYTKNKIICIIILTLLLVGIIIINKSIYKKSIHR